MLAPSGLHRLWQPCFRGFDNRSGFSDSRNGLGLRARRILLFADQPGVSVPNSALNAEASTVVRRRNASISFRSRVALLDICQHLQRGIALEGRTSFPRGNAVHAPLSRETRQLAARPATGGSSVGQWPPSGAEFPVPQRAVAVFGRDRAAVASRYGFAVSTLLQSVRREGERGTSMRTRVDPLSMKWCLRAAPACTATRAIPP